MIYLFILFALLNALDAWTTYQAIRFGAHEAWLPKFVFDAIGVKYGLIVLKVGIVAAVWYFAADLGLKFIAVADAGYAALIVWNLYQLRRQKHG